MFENEVRVTGHLLDELKFDAISELCCVKDYLFRINFFELRLWLSIACANVKSYRGLIFACQI